MVSVNAVLLLAFITLSSAVGLVGLVVGAVNDSWWTNSYLDAGLWNIFYSSENMKDTRVDILHFDKNFNLGKFYYFL